MFGFLRVVVVLLSLLVAALICVGYFGSLEGAETSTVYVRVEDRQATYILSFRSDNPNPNVVFASKSLPANLEPRSMTLSPDGRWIFARSRVLNANGNVDLFYAKVGQPFVNAPGNAAWQSLSADRRYLFYISVDLSGFQETFNFMNLATGERVELLVSRLPSRIPGFTLLESIPEYAEPVDGWNLRDGRVVFRCVSSDLQTNGFYSVDLSGIDFTKSGSYTMPPRAAVVRTPRRTSAGYLSPDGKKLAYIYLDENPELPFGTGFFKTAKDAYDGMLNAVSWGNGVAILDLPTGKTSIINATKDEVITNVAWSEDNRTLVYVKYLKVDSQHDGFQTYEFNSVIQQSKPSPIALVGAVNVLKLAVCGKTLFYEAGDTLYSAALNRPGSSVPLFSASSLDILGCAPLDAWTQARSGLCVPFCTPTPVVGMLANIKYLYLRGGDATNGQRLYIRLSCAACHDQSTTGPPTAGMYTRAITWRLKDPANAGETVEQYLADAIIHPNAYVVPGFPPGVMPQTYGDQLSLQELKDLVAYMMVPK
jgi:Cytochrome C oxidase, cbb3-type, subunit III